MTQVEPEAPPLRSPRRGDPEGPTTWERGGAASGIVGALALLGSMLVVSSTPSVDSSPATVRDHLASHYEIMIATAYVTVVAGLLLVPFLASLRTFTERLAGVAHWRWTVTLVAGATAISMLLLAGGLLGTAARLAHLSAEDASVYAAFVAAKLIATLALLPVAALVLVNARTIAASGRPERWLVRFDVEIAIFAVIGSVASVVDSDWLGPGEIMVTGAWFLIVLWILAIAGTIVRGVK